MNSVSAIIIDDEESARNVLNNLITKCCSKIQIVGHCKDLLSGVEKIKEVQPDVVFIDVQMPNYVGYEIANFFEHITFEIIFVTAFDKYAIKAIELNAIDYLVKPIERKRLLNTIEKLHKKINEKKELKDYKYLLSSIHKNEFKQIVIPELGDRRVIAINNIIAIEADGAYSKIHMKDNKTIVTSKNLKYFQEMLPDTNCFFRSHRTWIISLKHIQSINKSNLSLLLSNNISAKIARARFNDFEKAIK